MNSRWPTARWITMLALASLLLATLVSVAVVGWMPRPAPPPMRLDQAVQVLRGEQAAAPLGLHLATQVDEPRASGSIVETVFPESDSEHMFGANAMDLSMRPAAARAGHAQGSALVVRLTDFWR